LVNVVKLAETAHYHYCTLQNNFYVPNGVHRKLTELDFNHNLEAGISKCSQATAVIYTSIESAVSTLFRNDHIYSPVTNSNLLHVCENSYFQQIFTRICHFWSLWDP